MPTIDQSLIINAPIGRVFDLARSIDAHTASTSQTGERAIGGRTSGLIELGERVRWEARHFGITQQLEVEITQFERPHMFENTMIGGAFKSFTHQHYFSETSGVTTMRDVFNFRAPLGVLGRMAEYLFLKRYMERFLQFRNEYVKEIAESSDLKRYLHSNGSCT